MYTHIRIVVYNIRVTHVRVRNCSDYNASVHWSMNINVTNSIYCRFSLRGNKRLHPSTFDVNTDAIVTYTLCFRLSYTMSHLQFFATAVGAILTSRCPNICSVCTCRCIKRISNAASGGQMNGSCCCSFDAPVDTRCSISNAFKAVACVDNYTSPSSLAPDTVSVLRRLCWRIYNKGMNGGTFCRQGWHDVSNTGQQMFASTKNTTYN